MTMLVAAGCADGEATTGDQPGADGKSPLAEYMGDSFTAGSGGGIRAVRIGGGSGTEPTEEDLAKQRQVEDSIKACMSKEGFQYVPRQPESEAKSKFDDAFNLPPDKFAEQYGYGISTIDFGKPMGEDDDPNKAIRDALSAQAKKAYDKALNGDMPEGGVISGKPGQSTNINEMNTGCRGKAFETVYGKRDKPVDLNKFDSLFKDLEALRKRIESDPRVTGATQGWSDCMADGGKTGLKKPEDAPAKVHERLNQLTGVNPQQDKPTKVPSLDDVDPTKLAELRTFEIELAELDLGCKKKGYEEAYQKVQYELEKEFVETHKAQLEQYKESIANMKGGK